MALASPVSYSPPHWHEKGYSQGGKWGVVVTSGPPKTGGFREPDWKLHCNEHLLCAGEGASETAFQEVSRGCEVSQTSQASVTCQHTFAFFSPSLGFGARPSYTQK